MGYDKDKYEKFITQKVLLENEIFSEYEVAFKNSSEYKSIIKKKNLSKEEKEKQISNKMIEFIKGIEIDKFSIFQLVNYQNTLIIKAPNDNEEQKKFLGYDWSNAKGNEGIKYITDVAASGDDDETIENIKKISSIKTTLYDPAVLDNPEKLNFIIREAFDGKLKQINENLKPYANLVNLRDCIDFRRASFDKAINLSAKSKVEITSKYPLVRLVDFPSQISKGKSITQKDTRSGVYKVVAGGLNYAYLHNEFNRDENTITVSASGANAGYVNLWKEKIFASDCTTIRAESDDETFYIFYFLKNIQQYIFTLAKGAAQPHVYPIDLENLKIPKPPIEIQKQIVVECEKVDNEFKTIRMEIDELRAKMSKIFSKFGISFEKNGGGMS